MELCTYLPSGTDRICLFGPFTLNVGFIKAAFGLAGIISVVSLHPEKRLCDTLEVIAPSPSCLRSSARWGDNGSDFPYLNIDGQKAFLFSVTAVLVTRVKRWRAYPCDRLERKQ